VKFQQCHVPAIHAGVKMFSRPGPLLVESLECLVELLHSESQHYGHAGKLWQQVLLQGSS
jgi:hypothetical protein